MSGEQDPLVWLMYPPTEDFSTVEENMKEEEEAGYSEKKRRKRKRREKRRERKRRKKRRCKLNECCHKFTKSGGSTE
jgi:hypothetical protein